jgi:CRISPR-associated exonuclease Cas4
VNSEYRADQLLPLSGIQHFVFCRRQWALIHVERQWQENALTAEGRLLHRRADDAFFTESRDHLVVARSVPVASYSMGLSGVCDVVEFTRSPRGAQLPGREGFWLPAPVEYKRGGEKHGPSDASQLCAQAMCLEEMLLVPIPVGYMFYGKTRRRIPVELTTGLREFVAEMSVEMHAYFDRGHTPRVKASKACHTCSLLDICMPKAQEKLISASTYLRQQIERA